MKHTVECNGYSVELETSEELTMFSAWDKLVASYEVEPKLKAVVETALAVTKHREGKRKHVTFAEATHCSNYALYGILADGEKSLNVTLVSMREETESDIKRCNNEEELSQLAPKYLYLNTIKRGLSSIYDNH